MAYLVGATHIFLAWATRPARPSARPQREEVGVVPVVLILVAVRLAAHPPPPPPTAPPLDPGGGAVGRFLADPGGGAVGRFLADPGGGAVGRFLTDPGAALGDLGRAALGAVAEGARALAPVLVAASAAVAVAAVAAVAVVVARRARRRRPGALVEVAAPAEVDGEGAALFWRALHGALRSGRRLLASPPHVAFVLAWTAGRLRVRLWLPPGVSAPAVAHAVEAAWPGATTRVESRAAPTAVGVVGGEARLARPDYLPLATDHGRADPYRALMGAVGVLDDDEAAVLAVLVRPARARRLAQARAAVAALRAGPKAGLAAQVWAGLNPATAGRANGPAPPPDPLRLADARTGAAKLGAGPFFEARVRYAVAGPQTGWAARRRRRGRAGELAAALGAWAGHNAWRPRRRRASVAMAWDRLGRGSLLSLAEVVALAHLPTEAPAGWPRAGGRVVAPPPAAWDDDEGGADGW